MIRVSEMVLQGHPDKFCDQVADAIVAECVRVDPDAYAQIEVGVWSDEVWLSGGICTRRPLEATIEEIVHRTGGARYKVTSTVCFQPGNPLDWSAKVNDQCVIIGWAGYDTRTRYLPPEHFLAHSFREALAASCLDGILVGQGPDGKLLVILREEGSRLQLEHVLVTLQQRPEAAFLDVCEGVVSTIADAYRRVQEGDERWVAAWEDVRLSVNPNGPLLNGGSDGDNGQTGRKLRHGLLRAKDPDWRGSTFGEAPLAHRSNRGVRGEGGGGARRGVGCEGVPGAPGLRAQRAGADRRVVRDGGEGGAGAGSVLRARRDAGAIRHGVRLPGTGAGDALLRAGAVEPAHPGGRPSLNRGNRKRVYFVAPARHWFFKSFDWML